MKNIPYLSGIINNLKTTTTSTLTKNHQDPRCEIVMKAEHIPADQTDGWAAVGETIVFDVQSTNNGNVDIAQVTILDSVGECREKMSHKFQCKTTLLLIVVSTRNNCFDPDMFLERRSVDAGELRGTRFVCA